MPAGLTDHVWTLREVLIDVWVGSLLFHEQSVRRNPCCFKGSPRYLALSCVFR
jgi:hypothetical protein